MTDKPYTDQEVEIVAAIIKPTVFKAENRRGKHKAATEMFREDYRKIARAVLQSLADRGRLMQWRDISTA